jgi:hypothetical protein
MSKATPRTEGLTTGPPPDLDNAGARPIMDNRLVRQRVQHEPTAEEQAIIDAGLLKEFGARYYEPGVPAVHRAGPQELYDYTAYVGPHERIEVERGDSIFYLREANGQLHGTRERGPLTLVEWESKHMAIVVRGFQPAAASVEIVDRGTRLPYVNGCSTSQVIGAERNGDPTLQHLLIPAHSAEQAHHIHSTVRVVWVWKGKGISIVGMEGASVTTELLPGMVCILDPMSPHHFETPQGEAIQVIPFHVWSSGPGENNHPMMRGTHLMDQGA